MNNESTRKIFLNIIEKEIVNLNANVRMKFEKNEKSGAGMNRIMNAVIRRLKATIGLIIALKAQSIKEDSQRAVILSDQQIRKHKIEIAKSKKRISQS
jgi:hypothetical protein